MILTMLAAATTLTATPATLNAVLARSAPGTTIRLAPGDYGIVEIRNRKWARPITIDAGAARMSLVLLGSSGVNVRGGTFVGAPEGLSRGYSVLVRASSHVSFTGTALTGARKGMVIDRSTDVAVHNMRITRMTVDGINIASSQRVIVADSSCSEFTTGPEHPDRMQMWSTPKGGVTSDVQLLRNTSDGPMQGFTGFNHIRNGVDDGGFDRITISGNRINATYPNGVAISDCRDCTITDNIATTAPGARWMTQVRTSKCDRCKVSGNKNGRRP